MDGVGQVEIPDFPTADNSVESTEFYSPPIPGEEGLLRTSPHVGQDGAQQPDIPERSLSVPLPGAQGASGVHQPAQAELQRRPPSVPLMSPEELARVEASCKRHNAAARSLWNMLTSSLRALDTRIDKIRDSASNGPIRPVIL